MTSSDRQTQDAGLPSGEPCAACGDTAAAWTGVGLCDSCSTRLANALRDYRGRPTWGKPPGVCSICGWIGRLRAQEDWCATCHARWRKSGYPGENPAPPMRIQKKSHPDGLRRREIVDLDKLTRLRVMRALAKPGEENPYECTAPDCHETADPSRQRHCAMHEQRLLRNGTYGGHQCAVCGDDIKGRGIRRMLCDLCKKSWGYCSDTLHDGGRLLHRERMSRGGHPTGHCKPCFNRRQREKRRAA